MRQDERPCKGDAYHPVQARRTPSCRSCTNFSLFSANSGKCPGPDMRLLALAASEVARERAAE